MSNIPDRTFDRVSRNILSSLAEGSSHFYICYIQIRFRYKARIFSFYRTLCLLWQENWSLNSLDVFHRNKVRIFILILKGFKTWQFANLIMCLCFWMKLNASWRELGLDLVGPNNLFQVESIYWQQLQSCAPSLWLSLWFFFLSCNTLSLMTSQDISGWDPCQNIVLLLNISSIPEKNQAGFEFSICTKCKQYLPGTSYFLRVYFCLKNQFVPGIESTIRPEVSYNCCIH